MIAKHESAGRPRRVWVSKSGALAGITLKTISPMKFICFFDGILKSTVKSTVEIFCVLKMKRIDLACHDMNFISEEQPVSSSALVEPMSTVSYRDGVHD